VHYWRIECLFPYRETLDIHCCSGNWRDDRFDQLVLAAVGWRRLQDRRKRNGRQVGSQSTPIIVAGQIHHDDRQLWYGSDGGIFAPLLALGALLGSIVGQIAQMCYPSAVPEPAVFAVVGMGAMFASILRAPLSGILLIIEMTGNYEQMIPLLVACFFAYDVADLLKDTPIYDALFERDLARSGTKVNLDKPAVMEFEIEDGAPFDGKEVASLGLPPGCVIIGCTKDGVEIVPTAHTCLEASMKLTLAIDSKAADSVTLVVNGCRRSEPD
jgi:CIC family chloride channel protein